MRIVILTSSLYGTASHHLDALSASSEIKVAMVIYNEGLLKNRKKLFLRKLSKSLKIGVLGVLNGLIMRKWYTENLRKYLQIVELETKCSVLNIPFYKTPYIGSDRTIQLFKQADAELGISLGNGYIPAKIFSIPKRGMINIHHEILPEYQNAQSVIWQIYNGSTITGYTIHKIDSTIDTGEILYVEKIPITFKKSLADTVTYSYKNLLEHSALGLVKVIGDFDRFFSEAKTQKKGLSYTTPNFLQYLKMEKQFRRMKNNL